MSIEISPQLRLGALRVAEIKQPSAVVEFAVVGLNLLLVVDDHDVDASDFQSTGTNPCCAPAPRDDVAVVPEVEGDHTWDWRLVTLAGNEGSRRVECHCAELGEKHVSRPTRRHRQ